MSICNFYFSFLMVFSILLFMMSMNFMVLDYSLFIEYEFMSLNSSIICMTILIDWMSLLFTSFVFYISSMVIYYSNDYMYGEVNLHRFIILVVLFVLSMLFMIISPNLISILLGWDGLGLVSFCLVIFYQNNKSLNAGIITALSNRIGDVAILMSIAWMFNYGSWNYMFYLDCMSTDFSMKIVAYFVILASFTKSAQIPFSSWLPAAMAAPTPVSSLVHSSTLVTAGVYLLIRFHNCLDTNMVYILLFFSSLTMFMAGLCANYEFDLKKVIALSTLSQLGLMMSILALGDKNLAFFHLLTHALFKALLFMCAGCMIHNFTNYQDIRYMGSLVSLSPLTCTFFNICNFALCGLPFMSGFYSKDLILEFMSFGYINMYMYMVFYISIGLTVSYSLRLCYYTLFSNFNFLSFHMANDQSVFMLKGMGGLILLVIFGGSMLNWLIFSSFYFICLPMLLKLMTLLMMAIGLFMGYWMSNLKNKLSNSILGIFYYNLWNFSVLSTYGVNYYPLKYSGYYFNVVDHGWSEYFGGKKLFNELMNFSVFMQILVNNSLKIYLMMFMMWIILLLMYI